LLAGPAVKLRHSPARARPGAALCIEHLSLSIPDSQSGDASA
jgi:hypothetical protein